MIKKFKVALFCGTCSTCRTDAEILKTKFFKQCKKNSEKIHVLALRLGNNIKERLPNSDPDVKIFEFHYDFDYNINAIEEEIKKLAKCLEEDYVA